MTVMLSGCVLQTEMRAQWPRVSHVTADYFRTLPNHYCSRCQSVSSVALWVNVFIMSVVTITKRNIISSAIFKRLKMWLGGRILDSYFRFFLWKLAHFRIRNFYDNPNHDWVYTPQLFCTNSLHTAQLIVASLRGRFWRTRNILMIMFCREMCVSSLKLFQHYTKRVVASKQITQVLWSSFFTKMVRNT